MIIINFCFYMQPLIGFALIVIANSKIDLGLPLFHRFLRSSPSMADNYPKDEVYLSAVIPKRIKLFKEFQAKQLEQLQSLPHDPIKVRVTTGDGNKVKEGKRWETTPKDMAMQVSKGLADSALVSSVNDVLWDMDRPLEGDCSLEFFEFDSDKGRDAFRHSSAHILGQVLEQEYGCKLCIGSCTTREEGFYYDAFYGDLGLNDKHFPNIEAAAAKAALLSFPYSITCEFIMSLRCFITLATASKSTSLQEGHPFERIEVTKDQALDMFSDNKFKVEHIKDKIVTVYRCGPLVDLCSGPHIPSTSFLKAFKCLKASPAYWRGNRESESLQIVYGISYPDDKQLKAYLESIEEAKKYDHRLLGQQHQLFFCHPLSPGSWFFLPHGTRVYNKLMEFIKKEYWERGYTEVISPNMYNMSLWETSGHAANYKENMFTFDFGLKPMNCPGHCLMFQHRVRSYKELPIRLADFGVLHRNEASGALSGLTDVRRFQQDDAHIFCTEKQVSGEVKGALDFVDFIYTNFGFTYELKLSTRNEGDGAFYGPKIDITVSDAMKRRFQCATLQDEGKIERPVMIHRAVLGSVERMFAILLEHYKGIWPFWLSPRQAIVCSLSNTKDHQEYAEKVREQIHEAGYYVDVDTTDRDVNCGLVLVREAQVAQYNYILVVGDEEKTTGQVTVQLGDEDPSKFPVMMSIETLLDEFKLKTANFL
ncbi:unnamed protein product [Thlaspi arvense]|uniref:threonine--tRNA ligase n=1 Tax=Thlaspi arvense TaxID=13288 RepID=A0AAU9RAC0_THLAR|nr:unnamed protein product [Thlaspi arvense]